MSLSFDILHTSDPGGRRAVLSLPHGEVQTPVFMPVGTAATVKAVPQDILETNGAEGLGAQIILANTYHLYLRPGHELIRRMGGVHRFMSWDRPMLTDSGGFQVFSLSKLRKISAEGVEFRSHLDGSKHFFSPEHSMDVQIALGADIAMVFDECVEHPASYERTRDSMALTHAWAARSKDHFEANKHLVPWYEERNGQTQSLFGIVQGGMYPDLRRESAERLVEMDFPGYAIGGLAVGEPREVTREMIARTLEILPRDKPRYVMGVGYPDEIEEYAKMGVDMMDCVLPTRAARHGLLFTGDESGAVIRLNIKKQEFAEDPRPIDSTCTCRVCARYTRAYLRHLFSSGEALSAVLNSIHNLAVYLDTMDRVRKELAGEPMPSRSKKTAKPTAAAVKREVAALADPGRARFLQRFFRTGAGEYAEGDRLLGLTVPHQRIVAKGFRDLPLTEAEKLLASPFHEHRLIALIILVEQHRRADPARKSELSRFYLEHLEAVNNWDLVDASAAALVGEHLNGSGRLLEPLLNSPLLWHRRIAIVSTFAELRAGRTVLTFRTAELLLDDKHDLIHKAVGWLLREAGKKSPEELLAFLRAHYSRLPRTTLRYAIERLDVLDRKTWLKGPP